VGCPMADGLKRFLTGLEGLVIRDVMGGVHEPKSRIMSTAVAWRKDLVYNARDFVLFKMVVVMDD